MMRKLLLPLVLAATFGSSLAWAAEDAKTAPAAKPAPAAEYKSKSPQLKRAEFEALLAQPESLLIIDLRRPDELTAIGGLPVYLSIQAKDLEKSLAYIPKDRTIVTVSNHSGRSGVAADFLTAHGFKVAGALGAQTYEAEGGTLTKIEPRPSNTAEAEKR